jgi:hypothetical protein
MDGVVGKACERKPAAREKNFSFISRREFPDAVEDVCGLVSAQHSDWS